MTHAEFCFRFGNALKEKYDPAKGTLSAYLSLWMKFYKEQVK